LGGFAVVDAGDDAVGGGGEAAGERVVYGGVVDELLWCEGLVLVGGFVRGE